MKNNKDENSKQRILDSATKLFASKGYNGTSVREICKEANTNICMISYFWGGKKELYEGIIYDLISRQTEYAKQTIDFNVQPEQLSKGEQIQLLMQILERGIDFLYSDNISRDLIIFLINAHQNSDLLLIQSPAFVYLRKLLAAIFDKDLKDREIILKTGFIISQINSPKILPAFSLSPLRQDDFVQKDIKIIKDNIKLYVNALLKEANIV